MGISDNVKTILRNVKKIGGIPDKVMADVKKEMKKVHNKLDDMNAMAALEEFMTMIMLTLEKHFKAMERQASRKYNEMNRKMASSLGTIHDEFKKGIDNIHQGMKDMGDEMRYKLDQAVEFADKLKDDIFDAMGPFVKEIWSKYLPYIIVILAVLLFPTYSPILMVLFKLVF